MNASIMDSSVIATKGVAAAAPAQSTRRLTLRAKGMLALAALGTYAGLAAWFLAGQRQDLVGVVQQIDSHQQIEAMLVPAFNTLAHTLVQTQAILNSPEYTADTNVRYSKIADSLDPLLERLEKLRPMDPGIDRDADALDRSIEAVRADPSGRNLEQVRNAEQALIATLNDIVAAIDSRTLELGNEYHDLQQFITYTAVGTSVVGALASAAVILIFFTRLARDIKRLQNRAFAIVSGYSGEPLDNPRHDEVGGLIDAVNRMQVDLRRWEQQQEISRQQRFHQEKMAAIGSMASAIGHEVSNPIAAISGVAQFLIDETRGDDHKTSRLAHDFGVQILTQTERISLIMRQLSGLTRAHSPDPELLDLNELVRSTCSFIAYDKRFRGVEFQQDLDPGLPAVTAVADHMTQVLMNLLINAADAMEHLPRDGAARIRISTRQDGDDVRLCVEDNGHGMTPEVMARAFDESFTTKPVGKGRGIGLFLCKTLIEQARARIDLASTSNVGTAVTIRLPLAAHATPRA